MPAPRVRGVGVLTGWGDGVGVFAGAAPIGVKGGLIAVPTPATAGERFRRATRECLLAATAVRAAASDAALDAVMLASDRTGVVYVTAAGYAAANRAFLEDEGSTTLHFPYTAPSAVPGEVTIEFGIRGPYVNLMGGGTAALHGLWYAARWLDDAVADRVLVLAVETMHEVRDLFARARRLYQSPLVEGAACVLLERGDGEALRWASITGPRARAPATVAQVLDAVLRDVTPRVVASSAGERGPGRAEARLLARRAIERHLTASGRFGGALACAPLIGLADARASGLGGPCLLTAAWRDEYGAVLWPL